MTHVAVALAPQWQPLARRYGSKECGACGQGGTALGSGKGELYAGADVGA